RRSQGRHCDWQGSFKHQARIDWRTRRCRAGRSDRWSCGRRYWRSDWGRSRRFSRASRWICLPPIGESQKGGTMTEFPGSPRVLKGGIVLLDPDTFTVLPNGVIALQYNPDTLSRTLKIKGAEEGGDRSEALRLTGPPIETIKLDAEIDATDQFETADSNTLQYGIFPQLAALEALVYPKTSTLQANFNLSQQGTLEIMPMLAPLPLFIWSANRIVPVRLTDLSITEEAFDPALNPIRAKVSLGMLVLSIDDLNFADKGGSLFIAYQRQKE